MCFFKTGSSDFLKNHIFKLYIKIKNNKNIILNMRACTTTLYKRAAAFRSSALIYECTPSQATSTRRVHTVHGGKCAGEQECTPSTEQNQRLYT